MFHTACSGHWTKSTPSTIAAMSSTSVERRRYKPAATIAIPGEEPDPPRQPERGRDHLPPESSVEGRARARSPRSCFTGIGIRIQDGNSRAQLPVENTFAYRMLCVYDWPPDQRQRPHRGSATRDDADRNASGHVRRGDRTSQSSTATSPRRSRPRRATSREAAMSTAGSHGASRCRACTPSAPSANSASAERDRRRSTRPRACSRCSRRRSSSRSGSCTSIPSAAIANAGGAGHGARSAAFKGKALGREHASARDGDELERDVVRANGRVQRRHQHRREREVVLPDREPRVPVRRPALQPEVREPVVLEDHGHHTWAPMSPPLVVVFANRSAEVDVPDRPQPHVGVDDHDHDQRASTRRSGAPPPVPTSARAVVRPVSLGRRLHALHGRQACQPRPRFPTARD